MKRRLVAVLILLLIIAVVLGAQEEEEKPVVCVLELVNIEANNAFEVLCSTVRDTINLTLGTMGMYRMRTYTFTEGEEEIDIEDIDSIKKYSRQNKIDNVIFGSVFTDDAGKIVIELNVYDIRENKVTISERGYSENLLGIFDASDGLALSIMENFSGVHIVYGTIRIESSGFDGVYSVYIDGEFAGQNPMLIQDVFIGRHQLVVKDARMVGEHICYSEEVFIEEGMTLPVEISIPYLTGEEMDEFKRLDTVILRNWGNSESRDMVLESLGEALTMVEVSPELSCYDELKGKYESWQEEYSEMDFTEPVEPATEERKRMIYPVSMELTEQGGVRVEVSEEISIAGELTILKENLNEPVILLEEIEIPAIDNDGVSFTAVTEGTYRFEYKEGTYGMSSYDTVIHNEFYIIKNRPVTVSFYSNPYWTFRFEDGIFYEKNGRRGKYIGEYVDIPLLKDEYLTFIILEVNFYGDNFGWVIVSVYGSLYNYIKK